MPNDLDFPLNENEIYYKNVILPKILFYFSDKKSNNISPAASFNPASAINGVPFETSTSPSSQPLCKTIILDQALFEDESCDNNNDKIILLKALNFMGFKTLLCIKEPDSPQNNFFEFDKDFDPDLLKNLNVFNLAEDYQTLSQQNIARDKLFVFDESIKDVVLHRITDTYNFNFTFPKDVDEIDSNSPNKAIKVKKPTCLTISSIFSDVLKEQIIELFSCLSLKDIDQDLGYNEALKQLSEQLKKNNCELSYSEAMEAFSILETYIDDKSICEQEILFNHESFQNTIEGIKNKNNNNKYYSLTVKDNAVIRSKKEYRSILFDYLKKRILDGEFSEVVTIDIKNIDKDEMSDFFNQCLLSEDCKDFRNQIKNIKFSQKYPDQNKEPNFYNALDLLQANLETDGKKIAYEFKDSVNKNRDFNQNESYAQPPHQQSNTNTNFSNYSNNSFPTTNSNQQPAPKTNPGKILISPARNSSTINLGDDQETTFECANAGEVLNDSSFEPQIRTTIIKLNKIQETLERTNYEARNFDLINDIKIIEQNEIDDLKTQPSNQLYYHFKQDLRANKKYRLLSAHTEEEFLGITSDSNIDPSNITIERGDDDFFYATAKQDCSLQ